MVPERLKSKRMALIFLFAVFFISNEVFELNMDLDAFRDVIFAGIGGYTVEQTVNPVVKATAKRLSQKPSIPLTVDTPKP